MKTRINAFSITMTMVLALLWFLSFSSVAFAGEADGHEQGHGAGISLFSFVKPLGLCALGSALVAFATGLFRRKLGKRFLKVHRTFAWLTVGFALCHGSLVLALF